MKKVNIIPVHSNRSTSDLLKDFKRNGFVDIRGQLEVAAYKNGKMIHYDKGDNLVTIWAKHSTMHLLTGEVFTSHGRQRSFDETTDHVAFGIGRAPSGGPGEGLNTDGTLLSDQQYFSNNTDPDFKIDKRWSRSTIDPNASDGDTTGDPDDVRFPFFPSKMLFGTGFEFSDWADVLEQEDYASSYTNEGWDQSTFESNIDNANNSYSSTISVTNTLIQTRSMNDIYAGSLTTPEIEDTDIGIKGAIKDGFYSNSDTHRLNLNSGGTGTSPKTFQEENGNEFLDLEWAGVGNPSFIYARREARFFQTGGEVTLSSDDNIENKITYNVIMPEQTGTNANIFYPYNGYTLKVAGLFCDARLLLQNTVPTSGSEKELYDLMGHGIMYAKRYISPIQKSHDVSISSRWTLYL